MASDDLGSDARPGSDRVVDAAVALSRMIAETRERLEALEALQYATTEIDPQNFADSGTEKLLEYELRGILEQQDMRIIRADGERRTFLLAIGQSERELRPGSLRLERVKRAFLAWALDNVAAAANRVLELSYADLHSGRRGVLAEFSTADY